MSLGAVLAQSTNIMTMRVEKVDKERNLIIFRKVQDLKGKHPAEVIKHNIGRGGFHPREWQFIMEWAEPGKVAVFCHNGGASETCINNYWYQAYAGGEWWNMSHGEPYLLRSFAGNPEKLASAVTSMLAGQEVIVPCMMDGEKTTLQLRTGKIQRLRASLKLQDYNPKRDFVGWGGEDFRQLAGMPAFSHYASLNRIDPEAHGLSTADFDGDGKPDLCLYGSTRVVLLQNAGTSFNEVSIPYQGGARAAVWADYNGDKKPDLLLATPAGPRLLTNLGGSWKDDTASIPTESYYHLTAANWLDYDADGRPDILLANGYLGLRLYRNLGPGGDAAQPLKLGKWHYIGPFDNAGMKGFERAYPPEAEFNLAAQYDGKAGAKALWKEAEFKDGAANSLALFKPEHNQEAVIYLYREIEASTALDLPISLGSDDTLSVWLNGQKLMAENVYRACAPDQNALTLRLKPGKNALLLKVCQGSGDWGFYFAASAPAAPPVRFFSDISSQVGLGLEGLATGVKGDQLLVADVNRDGRPDVLYSVGRGMLLLNTKDGFVAATNSGIDYQAGLVTPSFGDYDGDQHLDLFVPQNGTCKLFRNDGSGRFSDVTPSTGDLARPLGQATSAVWTDFDRDGKLDLFIGCLRGPNRFLHNAGQGRFTDAGETLGLQQRVFNTRGLSVLDLNKDGVPDVVFTNEGQESAILLGNAVRANKPQGSE